MNRLSAELQETIHKIRALRAYTVASGFRTTRSQKDLLAKLGSEDLAAAIFALQCEHPKFEIVAPGVAACSTCGLEEVSR